MASIFVNRTNAFINSSTGERAHDHLPGTVQLSTKLSRGQRHVSVCEKNPEDRIHQRRLRGEVVRLSCAVRDQRMLDAEDTRDLRRFRVDAINQRIRLERGKGLLVFFAQMAAQVNPEVPVGSLPPREVNVKASIEGRADEQSRGRRIHRAHADSQAAESKRQ